MIIKIHTPTTLKPGNTHGKETTLLTRENVKEKPNENFGFFLAGLIDGDGHFSKIPQLVICFSEKDAPVAYFLKRKIGYGVVSKTKNKKGYKYVISHSLGLEIVAGLIYNKLQHSIKRIQYNTRLLRVKNLRLTEKPSYSLSKNSWFAGFFLSDGCFQIKIVEGQKRVLPEIRLVIQIDQKEIDLLLQIKEEFGGSIGFRQTQNTYYYSSVSFTSAKNIIKYFDRFHLMGAKLTQYLLWRKVCLKVEERFHLTPVGVKWISGVKKRIGQLSL
jgi:hypothetical protein